MEQPYGELVVTTLRVVTWNVWGKFGPWNKRQEALKKVLAAATPDLVLLQESWCDVDGDDQCRVLSEHLGLPHHHHTTPDLVHGDWAPVNAIISRWPLRDVTEHQLPAIGDGWGGLALRAVVDGPAVSSPPTVSPSTGLLRPAIDANTLSPRSPASSTTISSPADEPSSWEVTSTPRLTATRSGC